MNEFTIREVIKKLKPYNQPNFDRLEYNYEKQNYSYLCELDPLHADIYILGKYQLTFVQYSEFPTRTRDVTLEKHYFDMVAGIIAEHESKEQAIIYLQDGIKYLQDNKKNCENYRKKINNIKRILSTYQDENANEQPAK